jgi:hypothetical protein
VCTAPVALNVQCVRHLFFYLGSLRSSPLSVHCTCCFEGPVCAAPVLLVIGFFALLPAQCALHLLLPKVQCVRHLFFLFGFFALIPAQCALHLLLLKVQCVRHLFLFIRVPFAHAPFFKSSVHSICSVNVESNCAFGMGTADGLNCKSTKCSIALICYRLINSAMKQGIAHLAKPLARLQNLCVLLCCKILFVHLKFASCVNLVQIFVSMRFLIFLQRLFRKCLLLIPFQRDCC